MWRGFLFFHCEFPNFALSVLHGFLFVFLRCVIVMGRPGNAGLAVSVLCPDPPAIVVSICVHISDEQAMPACCERVVF
jgi:hypothetical protein